jgi:U3 small nucleolar RNA-associated protein 3
MSDEDDVDAFFGDRDKVLLEEEEEEDESGMAGDEEGVMDLDVDESDEDDEEDDEAALERITSGWGKGKNRFYSGDNVEVEYDEDDQNAQLEEEAALMQQKKRLALLDEADFHVNANAADETAGGAIEQGSKKSGRKGKPLPSDASLLSEMNHDLDDISLAMDADTVEVERLEKKTAHLSSEDKIQKVLSDSPEILGLLDDFKQKLVELKEIEAVLSEMKVTHHLHYCVRTLERFCHSYSNSQTFKRAKAAASLKRSSSCF